MNYICKYLKAQKREDGTTTYCCGYYNDECPEDVKRDECGRGLCYKLNKEEK